MEQNSQVGHSEIRRGGYPESRKNRTLPHSPSTLLMTVSLSNDLSNHESQQRLVR